MQFICLRVLETLEFRRTKGEKNDIVHRDVPFQKKMMKESATTSPKESKLILGWGKREMRKQQPFLRQKGTQIKTDLLLL